MPPKAAKSAKDYRAPPRTELPTHVEPDHEDREVEFMDDSEDVENATEELGNLDEDAQDAAARQQDQPADSAAYEDSSTIPLSTEELAAIDGIRKNWPSINHLNNMIAKGTWFNTQTQAKDVTWDAGAYEEMHELSQRTQNEETCVKHRLADLWLRRKNKSARIVAPIGKNLAGKQVRIREDIRRITQEVEEVGLDEFKRTWKSRGVKPREKKVRGKKPKPVHDKDDNAPTTNQPQRSTGFLAKAQQMQQMRTDLQDWWDLDPLEDFQDVLPLAIRPDSWGHDINDWGTRQGEVLELLHKIANITRHRHKETRYRFVEWTIQDGNARPLNMQDFVDMYDDAHLRARQRGEIVVSDTEDESGEDEHDEEGDGEDEDEVRYGGVEENLPGNVADRAEARAAATFHDALPAHEATVRQLEAAFSDLDEAEEGEDKSAANDALQRAHQALVDQMRLNEEQNSGVER